MGMVEGGPIFAHVNTGPVNATGTPNLQASTQLFIKGDIGVTATSVGPHGNMSIARRAVLDVPLFGVSVGRHTTSWDAIASSRRSPPSSPLQGSFPLIFHF